MAETLIIANSTKEAISSKTSDSAFLSGGTEINRLNSFINSKTLISLKKIDSLKKISKENNFIKIGSMNTFQDLIENDLVPLFLKESAKFMASRTKRNMATIGGNIAISRSDSYLISTLMAANSTLLLENDEKIDICNYIANQKEYSGKLIKEIIIDENCKVYSKRFSNTAQSHAVITVSVGVNNYIYSVACSIKNLGNVNLKNLSNMLSSSDLTEEEIINYIKSSSIINNITDDFFGSKEYKIYLLGVGISDLYFKAKGGLL